MRLLLLSFLLFSLVGAAQDLIHMHITKTEESRSVQAHYQYESKDDHFAFIDLWLLKDNRYEYKITSNVYNAFSEGTWKKSKSILTLTSSIKSDNLPIKVSFRPKDSSDFDVKRIAFVKDLNGKVIANVFVYVNNDSTSCMDGDLLCREEYDSINRIRVQYENWGLSSPWVTSNPLLACFKSRFRQRKI